MNASARLDAVFSALADPTRRAILSRLASGEATTKYNEELVKAGVMLAGEGLLPSSKGSARVHFKGTRRTVIDGPFAETKELVAGFWLWQCKSLDEAIEWAKRCPNPMPNEESTIEIRQVAEASDWGEEYTPEIREREERIARKIEANRR